MSSEGENSSNNLINEKIFLLTNIFESFPNMPNKMLPLLSSYNNINAFYSFLNYNNDSSENNDSIKIKLELLNALTKLFEVNGGLVFLFLKKCKSNFKSFFDPLIDIYLNEYTQDIKDKKIIENLLLLIIKTTSVNKNIFDHIYQKLSKYFGKDAKAKLTNETFLKYLNLLDLFYTCSLGNNKIDNNNTNNNIINNNINNNTNTDNNINNNINNNSEVKKEIKNFIYFNGFKNKLTLTLNKTSNNINCDFPTLEYGFSFITWIKLEKDLIDTYFLVHKNDDNNEINLIVINYEGHQIKLQLADSNNLVLVLDNNIQSNYINISSDFKYNEWNNLAFIFTPKKWAISSSVKNNTFKIYINQHMFNFYLELKNFWGLLEKRIDSIYIFENVIGKSTSILYFSFGLEEDKFLSLINVIKEPGFYKIKHLYKFLLSNDKEYSKYSKNPKFEENNKININKIIDINLKEQNIKNQMCFLCPFSYNTKNNSIDDIFSNFIGILTPESGVNFYNNNFKNIEPLGGIINLLPIAELMLLTQNIEEKNAFSDKDYINYDLLDKDVLNENTFLKYIIIIKKIIIGNKLNLINSNKHKFFSSLELFLEKFPSNIYTSDIMNEFLQIGKETFGLEDDIEENFVNMILLNEKIFSKFSQEVQQKLWDGVHAFFTSDYLQMKESIPMSKICLLLRFYDSKRYDKFCCEKHAELFRPDNIEEKNEIEKYEMNIMKPDMNTKVSKLFETIELYLDKFPNEDNNVNLFKLLTLDLSPCLQIKIIKAYKNFFEKKRRVGDDRSNAFKTLLNNNIFDIYEFIFSISLLDVKVELLDFLKVLMRNYDTELDEYCTRKHFKLSKIFEFIGHQLLPLDLKVELNNLEDNINNINDSNEGKVKKTNYIFNLSDSNNQKILLDYFNKKIFEKDLESMWTILNEWLIENNKLDSSNINDTKSMLVLKINSFVVSLCIQFVSQLNPFYIDSLLIIIYSYFKNPAIANKEDLYENEMLFPWIIETIFFFYDTKNWEYFNDIEYIQLIQQHSIELFKEFISEKRSKQENEALINYIFDFAYYLKSKNNDENNLNKIGAIIRLILSQILQCANWDMNLITKLCCLFMIFFKNSEKFFLNKQLLNSFLNQDDQNLFEALVKKTIQNNSNIIIKRSNEIKENQNSSPNAMDYIYNEENSEQKNNTNEIKPNEDEIKINDDQNYNYLISAYIYKSIFLKNTKGNKDQKTLIQIWSDFELFNYIIDYYQNNIWGTSYLCKKIKLNYTGNIFQVSKELIQEYSLNSKNKNILLNDLYKVLNFIQEEKNIQKIKQREKELKLMNKSNNDLLKYKQKTLINKEEEKSRTNFWLEEGDEDEKNKLRSKTKEKPILKKKQKNKNKNDKNRDKSMDRIIDKKNKNKITKENKEKNEEKDNNFGDINILKINLLLLSIATDLTKNEKEKNFLINKYEQFLLYCIICSLNLSQIENYREFIHSNLGDLIGYGLVFLKQINEEKYKEFINIVIVPLFQDIFYEKSKILKNIFSSSKTSVYENSALFELFILGEEIKDKNSVNSPIINDILISRTKISRISSVMEKSLNNLINPILNLDIENINDKTKIVSDVIYEQQGKSNNFVMFVVDSMRLKRHVINSIVIYYLGDKRRKNTNKKIKNKYEKTKNDDSYIGYEFKYFYNINNKNKNTIDKKISYEKLRLSNVINDLIPFFETQIKKYSTSSILQEKKRRKTYKSIKKKLFSWKEFWSNRYIFYKHPEHLKCKIKNHLTKDMTKIILTPILDMKYYMPEFSKFDSSKLFNEGDYNYKINLDLEEILREKDSKEENIISQNQEINSKFCDNLGFNYLECIYKLSYDGIWEKYKKYNEEKFNFENNTIANITRNISVCSNYEIFQSQFSSQKLFQFDNNEHEYNCCLVKLTRHINGILLLEQSELKFIFNIKEKGEDFDELNYDEINFDKDLGTCFGSTFKIKKSDNDKIALDINYGVIKYIFIRYYYYQETGLEIYTNTNKNYYFNFKTNYELNRAKTELLRKCSYREIKGDDFKGRKILGYEKILPNSKKKSYPVSEKIKEWRKYKISTLEYLMWMNIYGGRSLNDLTQYPVFPWIITDYISDDINQDEENDTFSRNLFLPMGMIEVGDKSITRKETFIDTYDLIKNELKENFSDFNYNDYLKKADEYYDSYINKKSKLSETDTGETDKGETVEIVQLSQLPSFYGSHYSNPTYVTHYLARIFPFAFVSIEIQGDKFDDPNRMFISLNRTFESATTTKDDVRELIPEFYLLPEMFQNNNNLNLAQGKTDADNNKIIINDVELPSWCNDDPNNFISEKRKFLEKSNLKINKWIDIIFGNYQRGEKAEEIHNLFKAQTYEKMVKIDNIKDVDMRNALMRLVEVGLCPMQILDSDSKPRIEKKIFLQQNQIYAKSKGKSLDECENLIMTFIKSQRYENYCVKNYENRKLTSCKDYKQAIEPMITKIICLNQKLLQIFINNEYCYTINLQNFETKGTIEESNLYKLDNYSSKFAPNYQITNNMNSFVINKTEKYILKAGFWDNRIEYNTIPSSSKEESINKVYYTLYGGPIVNMVISEEENILVCGTKLGYILYYDLNLNKNLNLYEPLYLNAHSDEITSISINDTLHLCATTSLDGYIMLYTLPGFSLVRSIQVSKKVSEADISEDEFTFADNIFLSSSPLPCIIIFISSKQLFIIYNINGKYIGEVEESEDTKKLNSAIIFKNLEFQEFLIYGTDDGYIKIRSFPNMKMINMINPFEGQEIKTIELSLDKRYCYAWSYSNKIAIIKDLSVVGIDIKENKEKKGNEQNEEDID